MKCPICNIEYQIKGKLKLNSSPLASIVLCESGKQHKLNALVCAQCGKVEFFIFDEKKIR